MPAHLPAIPLATESLRFLTGPPQAFAVQILTRINSFAGLYDLCSAYEKTYHRSTSTKEGVFYTPADIAQRIVREALGKARAPRAGLLLLDPACGSGVFLLAAFESLARTPRHARRVVCASLYGIDKDPAAAMLTRFVIARAYELRSGKTVDGEIREALCAHIQEGNTLLDSFSATSLGGVFPEAAARGGFDFVVGNPPYGLSREGRLSAAENELLKRSYAAYREGKINKYLAFMARGHELLNSRGVLSYIVPNGWLGIRGGKKMRELFLNAESLEEITHFSYPVFSEAGVEAVLFRVRRGTRHARIRLRRLDRDGEGACRMIPARACRENLDASIPISWSDDIQRILAQVKAHSLPLAHESFPFRPRIALQAYCRGKGDPPQTQAQVKAHVYDRAFKEDEHTYPYLEGRDIRRYTVSWSGGYLKHGKWLAEPQKIEFFRGARVVLREITNPLPDLLNAAVVETPMLYNKSVLHVIRAPDSSPECAWALLAVLNSRLASFILYHTGRKTQRALFPKIVNDDLKHFPLPKDFLRHTRTLAGRARAMTALVEAQAPAEKINREQGEIDELVCRMYRIDSGTAPVIRMRR